MVLEGVIRWRGRLISPLCSSEDTPARPRTSVAVEYTYVACCASKPCLQAEAPVVDALLLKCFKPPPEGEVIDAAQMIARADSSAIPTDTYILDDALRDIPDA